MSASSKTPLRFVLETATTFIPWLVSMYLLYWFEYAEIWTPATAHRGKISVAILVMGMGLSFLIYSYFSARMRR